jgi:capsular polysaccharide biosynthesis protein
MSDQINPGTFVEDDEISFLDLLTVIVENLKLLILGPLAAGILALGVSFLITPTFTAKTTLIPPASSGNTSAMAMIGQLTGISALAGAGISVKTPTDQYLAYLESNTLRDELIQKFKLRERYEVKYQQKARDTLKKFVKITADKKSGLIQIEVEDKDPKFAAELANSYVDSLSNTIGKLALKEARVKREFLEKQITEAAQKSYQSPIVREALIQSLIREYEVARIDEARNNPFLAQVDFAEVPEYSVRPQKLFIAITSALITSLILLFIVFLRNAWPRYTKTHEISSKLEYLKKCLRADFHF